MAFHFAVKLGERIHHDLLCHFPHDLVVFRAVVLEHARNYVARVGGGTEDFGDPLWDLSLPLWTDEQIETWRRPVHLAYVSKAISAQIDDLIHPEPVAEVRHLNDDG